MAEIEIYTQPWCPYCARAISLLEKKGVQVREIEAPHGTPEREEAVRPLRRADIGAADLHRRAAYRRLRRPDGAGARRQARSAAAGLNAPLTLPWHPGVPSARMASNADPSRTTKA